MSLNKKTLLFMSAIFGVMFLILAVISFTVLLSSFEGIEKDKVLENIERGENALNEKIQAIDLFNLDWSVWDDTYKFISDKNEAFIKSNLVDSTFIGRKINVMVFVNDKGEIVWSKAYDLKAEGEIPLPKELLKHLVPGDLLLEYRGIKDSHSGIILTEEGPLLISSQPIVTSERQGPIKGGLIMGRFLDESEINDLQKTTKLNLVFDKAVGSEEKVWVDATNFSTITGNKIINDIYGKPILVMRVSLPRDIYQQGIWTIVYFAAFVIATGAITLIGSLFFTRGVVLSPIEKLTTEVREIGLKKDFSSRVSFKKDGEITSLAGDINTMLSALETLKIDIDKKNVELVENLKVIEEQNKSLRSYEFQLRAEKASVEKKVEDRTHELEDAKSKISEGWLGLQQEKAKLAASINSLSMGFMIIDIEGNTLISNPAIEKIFGVSPSGAWSIKEIAGQLPEINLAEMVEKSRNERKNFEKKDITLGNSGRFLRIFVSPITLMDGAENVIGSVILFEDISEAKVLERSRDEFFSIASHELRTPLTAIRGNTALIRDYYLEKIKDPEFAEMVSDIHESSVRLIGMVNEFLNMSRLEMGKMVFKKESVDVGQITQEVIDELKVNADGKKLYLKSTLTANLPPVLADKDKVREILLNLVGNGVNYTQSGGVTLSGGIEEGFLKIVVTDTGRGVSKENQPFLFHKFQQAGGSLYTRDATKGTGLGLYISKLTVEGMGGRIWLETSEVGKGSSFAFTLPIAKLG